MYRLLMGVLILMMLAGAPDVAFSAQMLERSSEDRPDDTDLYQFHMLYVVASDGVDRAFDAIGIIGRSVKVMQNWFAQRGNGRQLRIDTFEGEIDVTFVRLNSTQAELADEGVFIRDRMEAELIELGFNEPHKLYLAIYDGLAYGSCASSAHPPKLMGNLAVVYLNGQFTDSSITPCSESLFFARGDENAGYLETSLLHEAFHLLGAAPACGSNHVLDGHTGDDPRDLMYAGELGWQPDVIDIGNDDYWQHNLPGCTDVSLSVFLEPLPENAELPPGWADTETSTACSLNSDTSAEINFANASGHAVDIYWIDYECAEVWYATLQPGEGYVQSTFVTHPWRVRNPVNGALMLDFIPTETQTYNLSITD